MNLDDPLLKGFAFAPDDGSGGAPTETSGDAAPSESSPEPTIETSSEVTEVAPTQDASATPQQWSVREYLKQQKIDALAGLDSDEAAVSRLIEFARSQGTAVSQYEQRLQQQAERERLLASQLQILQQQAQRVPEAPPKPKWEAKPFDPTWLTKVDPDTGKLLPEYASKVQEYQDWARAQQQRLLNNPEEFIAPFLPEKLSDRLGQLEQLVQQLQGVPARIDADRFVAANSGWMHARDGQGNMIYQNGQPALTQQGHEFIKLYGELAAEMPNAPQDRIAERAKQILRGHYSGMQQAAPQTPPATTPAPKPAPVGLNRLTNRNGSLDANGVQTEEPVRQSGWLAAALTKNAKENGGINGF